MDRSSGRSILQAVVELPYTGTVVVVLWSEAVVGLLLWSKAVVKLLWTEPVVELLL